MVSTVQPISNDTLFPVKEVRIDTERQTQTSKSGVNNKLSKEEIEALVQELNKMMQIVGTTLSFYVDENTKRTVVKVLDARTKEVIRQIPPEEMLKVSQKISELLGILIDQQL